MKKSFCAVIGLLAVVLTACASDGNKKEITSVLPSLASEVSSDTLDQRFQPGDEVSIIGQKANSTLVNGDTIWVQMQQADGSFVIYHCQLKDDFLNKAEELKMGSVAKVKGFFLSLMDLEQENTSPLVTLYDCELME